MDSKKLEDKLLNLCGCSLSLSGAFIYGLEDESRGIFLGLAGVAMPIFRYINSRKVAKNNSYSGERAASETVRNLAIGGMGYYLGSLVNILDRSDLYNDYDILTALSAVGAVASGLLAKVSNNWIKESLK